jgi:hypothetical protein
MSNGKLIKEKRNVRGFDRIRIRDIGELLLEQGEKETLIVETDADLMSKVKTRVVDGELILEVSGGWLDKLSLGLAEISGRRVKYYLTAREIHGLSISGKGEIKSDRIATDRLKVGMSGKGEVSITTLETTKLSVSMSGRGEFSAAGSAIHQEININGSGEYKALDLEGQTTKINISGHGNASVWTYQELEANISGFGNVEYRGSPAVSHTISGLGSVRQLQKSD